MADPVARRMVAVDMPPPHAAGNHMESQATRLRRTSGRRLHILRQPIVPVRPAAAAERHMVVAAVMPVVVTNKATKELIAS
jgi:hypothetical protein